MGSVVSALCAVSFVRPAAAGRAPVRVAVVDTGIVPLPSLAGSIDRRESRSFLGGPVGIDPVGHGTAMAAIIHRIDPEARLVDLRAMGATGGTDGTVARAIAFAVSLRVSVVDLSAASAGAMPKTRLALADAARHGVLVVVAATSASGALASSSNWGRRHVLLAASGVGVPTCSRDGTTTFISGTSPAAAEVAGVAARLVGTAGPSPLRAEVASRASPDPLLGSAVASGRAFGLSELGLQQASC